jgi:hypothetical protein
MQNINKLYLPFSKNKMKMKTRIILFICTFLMTASSFAQWSVGARFGGTSGFSLKNYSKGGATHFEAITAFSFDENIEGFSATLLFEKFGAFDQGKKFGAILGVGETMVFEDDFHLGVSGIIGFDWRIGRRIGFQVDWLPTWFFIPESYFSSINIAGTVRWVFGGRATPAY